jgi:diguanylate cyclase (GGDEF)-like protein
MRSEQRKQPLWRRARPTGVAPVGLIVALAIACIVFAVLSSAHRADVVALRHERQLFSHALSDKKSQLAAEIEYIAGSKDALQRLWIQLDESWIHQQIGLRLKGQLDHTQVLLVEPISDFVQPLAGQVTIGIDWTSPDTLQELAPVLAATVPRSRYISPEAPQEESLPPPPPQRTASAVRLQMFMGRPAIVATARLSMSEERHVGGNVSPSLVMVSFILKPFLDQVSARLELPQLRMVDDSEPTGYDNALSLFNESGQPVVRFAWTPNRPGAHIVENVLPFISIALGCFFLLAAFVLRYMRRTTATIAAGEDRMRHMAMHDPLSGLPNRTLFAERLEALLDDVKQGGPSAALLSIDLDHFKDVNDTLGHHVGDALIGAVAQRLSHTLRDDDMVARLGGDEFAVLTSDSLDPSALEELGRRIIATLSAPYLISGHTLVIGASIGIVMIDWRSRDAADIMRFADMALYRAKNEGRNRVCTYDAAMNADLTQRKQLEHDLRQAIENDGLALLYQPLVTPDGERIVGVEALCRWPHPQRGLVPPSEFIPVAEQCELIVPLGEWVLRRACLDGRIWPKIMVAVNVSPLQFRRPDFVEVVERILEETGFDPARLELEVTESTLLGNVDGASNAMHRLKAIGVKIALDDFGTGYSSLQYLRKLPFDKLKIDRTFIHNIETAPDAAAIVHAIVSLGRGLGMKVTAEGVENAEQQLFLRAAGVHSMQGYRFGRAVDVASVTARLGGGKDSAAPARLAVAS